MRFAVLWAERFCETRHCTFPTFFLHFLWPIENSQDSPKTWRENPLYPLWKWPTAQPSGEIKQNSCTFMTTTESDRETRNCQQRKNVSILNRKSKAEKLASKQTSWPVTSSHPNPLLAGSFSSSRLASWGGTHTRALYTPGPLHLQFLLLGPFPPLTQSTLLIPSVPLALY